MSTLFGRIWVPHCSWRAGYRLGSRVIRSATGFQATNSYLRGTPAMVSQPKRWPYLLWVERTNVA
jgi:hypothetical protein